jgi:hypothetical protein
MSLIGMLRQEEKGSMTQGYTCSDEPKAQTRAVCRQRVRFDGSIPWIRALLLRRFPANHWPSWFTDIIAVWFITIFLLLMLLAKRIFKGEVVEAQRARRASTIAQVVASYLLVVWSVLFLYGARLAIKGDVPLSRAIPAGAFLLFFMGIFGWGLYRARRGKA